VARERKSQDRRARPADVRERLGGRSIALVGLMGAGKTTVGRRLAATLGLPFTDADLAIEEAAGMSIPEMFELHGEAHFRGGERRVIARLLGEGPQVLATGGGAFLDKRTRKAIAKAAVSVWLRAELPLLLRRVSRRGNRPLLNHDPEVVMKRLMEERYPVYAAADFTVDSRDVAHEVMVREIVDMLAANL
jgi:shikimate kinase